MNLEQLKTQHPAIYEAARARGVNQERDRVVAHLHLGRKSDALPMAHRAITSGEPLTPAIAAHYLAAEINRAAIITRQGESDEVEAMLSNIAQTRSGHTDELGEAVLDRLTKLISVDGGDE